jgi:hypothetical protein
VVFTQDSNASLGSLPLWHLELVLEVRAERYRVLGARPEIQYVYSKTAASKWASPCPILTGRFTHIRSFHLLPPESS